jgi:FkbM family methyltransferase
MLTYAQNFEDVILERLFKEVDKGFYVDVGAWDPTMHSVTRHFYDRGWSGVNLEPIASRIGAFEAERQRDLNLLRAVGPQHGIMTFYEAEEESYLSTLSPEVAAEMRERGLAISEHQIEVTTLDDVFDRYCNCTVEFLKIDVEGFEGEVLKGLNLKRHRPRALVIESTQPATVPAAWERPEEIGTWASWEPEVLNSGYILAYFDGLNRFYLRQEDAGLSKRLIVPVGLYDNIEYPAIVQLRATVEDLSRDRAEKQRVIDRLVATEQELRTDQAAKQGIIDRLVATEQELRTDQAAKQGVIDRLVATEQELRTDQAAKQGNIDRLVATVAEAEAAVTKNSSEMKKLRAELEDAQGRLKGKEEVLSMLGAEMVGYRASLGGALEVTYNLRRTPGLRFSGGRYIGSARADVGRRIAMDVMALQFGVSGGVEVYMRTLVQCVLGLQHIGVVLLCLDSQLEKLKATFGDNVAYLAFKTRPAMTVAGKVVGWLHKTAFRETVDGVPATFSLLREEIGAEILHCPIQCYSIFDFNIPAILHLHDLQHLHHPENFTAGDLGARDRLYGLSVKLASKIIATSDFVRGDIISKMNVPSRKVVTIPATWDPKIEAGLTTFLPEHAREHYRLPSLFGLFPAQFWPHKNHARLVEALAIIRQKAPRFDFKLVFTGDRRNWSGWPKVSETINRLGLSQHVVCLDYVPVEHLAGIYKNAAFCVMPSIFEASSYPVIEAQLLGCPAMCSNVTSLPELTRNGAGLLFDPFDAEDMAEKMLFWLENPDHAAACALRAAGKVRVENGMDRYAAAIAEVYRELVSSKTT